MTGPHHHYPGCGHIPVNQPPQPGPNTSPSVGINNYMPILLVFALTLILKFKYKKS